MPALRAYRSKSVWLPRAKSGGQKTRAQVACDTGHISADPCAMIFAAKIRKCATCKLAIPANVVRTFGSRVFQVRRRPNVSGSRRAWQPVALLRSILVRLTQLVGQLQESLLPRFRGERLGNRRSQCEPGFVVRWRNRQILDVAANLVLGFIQSPRFRQ